LRFIVQELKRYVRRPAFYVSIGVVVLCFFFEHRDYFYFWISGYEIYQYLDFYYLFVAPFAYGLFFYLIPLAAIPPAALSVIEDLQSNNMRMRLHRSTKMKYIARKICSVSVGSMLPVLIGCIMFLAFALLAGPLEGPDGMGWRSVAVNEAMQRLTLPCYGFPYIAWLILLAGVTAWLWGMVGMAIALVTLNKGATLIIGFLAFWGTDCLCNYLGLSDWRPFNLFFTDGGYAGGLLWKLGQNGLLLLLVTCLVWLLMIYRDNRL